MNYLMTIDAGTGSVRAVIFDENGNQVGVGQEEWVHLEEENIPDSMSFDYKNNWDLTLKCIKIAIEESKINPQDVVVFYFAGFLNISKNGDTLSLLTLPRLFCLLGYLYHK